MKKITLLTAIFATLMFNYSFAQVKGTSTTTTPSTTTSNPQTDKSDKSDKKDKVKGEMSGDAAQMAKDWTQKMDEVCNLDASQEKKVMEVNLKYANRLEELKAKYKGMDNPNSEAAKAEKDELTKNRLKEYSNILSKDQMQKFKDARDSKKDENNGSGSNSEKKDEMKEKYKNATPEEKEKMKEEMKDKKDK